MLLLIHSFSSWLLCAYPVMERAKLSQFQLLFADRFTVLFCEFLLALWASSVIRFSRHYPSASFFSLLPPYHRGAASVQKRSEETPLGTGYKFKLDWTEFENQNDHSVFGWILDAKMRKGALTEVSWIKQNTSCFYISVNPLCIIHFR